MGRFFDEAISALWVTQKQILDDFMDEEDSLNTVAVVDKVVVIPKLKAKNISEQVAQAAVSQSKLPLFPTHYKQSQSVRNQVSKKLMVSCLLYNWLPVIK